MSYYSDLSADSSEGSDSDSDASVQEPSSRQSKSSSREQCYELEEEDSLQLSSCILHLDLDCFYCQCEEIDRKLDKSRPLAIGQKHIIVTCNYEARRWGVKKLQLRENAYKSCPSLLIIEGSDLERYRRHSRKVYDVFRACVQTDCQNEFIQQKILSAKNLAAPPVRRGRGMDEMQADLTTLVNFLVRDPDKPEEDSSIFIYGEGNKTTTLTEDQTGQQTTVQPYQASKVKKNGRDESAKKYCEKQLLIAAHKLGRFIQRTVFEKTGFTATLGISTNSLLAKVACDLQKPMSVNVIYPWRASELMASMPLRKIPDAGRQKIQLLEPALKEFHGPQSQDSIWTCRHLLALPKSEVIKCLGSPNIDQCEALLQRCQGIDFSSVDDDQGGMQKTISVENSFRRGTVITPGEVWKGLEDLYIRLPRLLNDRRDWSRYPQLAYPTTIRLSARVLDRNLPTRGSRRRPFITSRRQMPFSKGKELIEEHDAGKQQEMIRDAVIPLVKSLVLKNVRDLDITRMNIAFTNFRDVCGVSKAYATNPSAAMTQANKPHASVQGGCYHNLSFSRYALPQSFEAGVSKHRRPIAEINKPRSFYQPRAERSLAQIRPAKKTRIDLDNFSNQVGRPADSSCSVAKGGIDPSVLSELPPDMIKEVVRDYKQTTQNKNINARQEEGKPKSARIDFFFSPKGTRR